MADSLEFCTHNVRYRQKNGSCKICKNLVRKRTPHGKEVERRWNHKNSWKRKGIDIDQEKYDSLNSAQLRLCRICANPNRNGFALAVDHDKDTGRIRGLLCHRCNFYLVGNVERLVKSFGVVRLREAIEYVVQE